MGIGRDGVRDGVRVRVRVRGSNRDGVRVRVRVRVSLNLTYHHPPLVDPRKGRLHTAQFG